MRMVRSTTVAPPPVVLNIIGLFAMSGPYPAGLSYLLAALLAVQHVNIDPSILPNHKLQINAYNTNCSQAQGLDAFYKEVYNPNRTSILALGGTCSHVTEATAAVANLRNMLQLSYSAVSPHLSNQDLFPSFFRVMTPEQNLTHARVELFRAFNWTRVFVIYQDYKLFSTLFESIQRDLQNESIEVKDEMLISTSVLKLKVDTLKVYDSEDGDSDQAWYKKVVWLLPSFFDHHWMNFTGDAKCTPHKIRQASNKIAAITINRAVKNDIPEEFQHMYGRGSKYYDPNSLYAEHRSPEAYDAVWAIAYALNNTLTSLRKNDPSMGLGNISFHNNTFFQLLKSHMQNVTFDALSGPFSFNARGERTPGILISRFLNGKVPVDGVHTERRLVRIDCRIKVCFWVIACAGVLVTVALLIFNITRRKHK
ncbi:gamma-aminobutyric acid type B receptor subunit 1-like [Aplysia californica]|uniref:Gamma-aminobutyric acid type B receptor subunit 1-like n=1 Tax=Aplysia californica TaxID=6500 RepID=A0ABM0ZVC9_APLCA|nr:gamma-aminobutyric acid type B receptor subunit 1-like [Aplysia californica]